MSDVLLDREASTEVAQEALAFSKTSSNTSGGETAAKFENPSHTLPLQARSCASPVPYRHRGSGCGSGDTEAIGLSSDKEGGSDALALHAQVEEQQQQHQVSCCCA